MTTISVLYFLFNLRILRKNIQLFLKADTLMRSSSYSWLFGAASFENTCHLCLNTHTDPFIFINVHVGETNYKKCSRQDATHQRLLLKPLKKMYLLKKVKWLLVGNK